MAISMSVTPLMAEHTTTSGTPGSLAESTMSRTPAILSAFPTEDPPNFMIFIEKMA